MDSAHQELHFLLLWASQLSKRSSGGLGEVKKTVEGNTKIAFPEICRAAATVVDPLKLLMALTGEQNLGDIPATAAQSPLQPRPQLIVWKLQSVNNGGDESFFACSSIESIILSTKLISGLQ